MKRTDHGNTGLSLIEVLLVVVILSTVATFLSAPLVTFYRSVIFRGEVEHILTVLDEARKSTLSSYNSSQYGVHFETNRIVLYQGAVFVEPNAANQEIILNSMVEISTTSISGGGDDVLFDRLTGETAQSGSVTVELTVGSSTAKTIIVHPTGLAEVL